MKPEEQVVSLELAKQLKKAGCPQDSMWYWVYFPEWNEGYRWKLCLRVDLPFTQFISADGSLNTTIKKNPKFISTFTVAELGVDLTDTIYGKDGNYYGLEIIKTMDNKWSIGYFRFSERDSVEANARAKMKLWLEKEKEKK